VDVSERKSLIVPSKTGFFVIKRNQRDRREGFIRSGQGAGKASVLPRFPLQPMEICMIEVITENSVVIIRSP